MIPIVADISGVIEEFTILKYEVKSLSSFILDRVSADFMDKWENQIVDNLHSTRNEYRKGIFQEETGDDSVVIGLTPRQSRLSMMIEDGSSQFDEKMGFSKSDKKKLGKNGQWYITVPFRYATSEALGESMSFSSKLPSPIQQMVKSQETPLNLSEIKSGAPEYADIGKNVTSGYQHKFNIYEGLHRVEIGSGSTEKRGAYMNFRRVSENSDPASWIHPGFEAKHLMEAAVDNMDISTLVDMVVDEFLSERQ